VSDHNELKREMQMQSSFLIPSPIGFVVLRKCVFPFLNFYSKSVLLPQRQSLVPVPPSFFVEYILTLKRAKSCFENSMNFDVSGNDVEIDLGAKWCPTDAIFHV